MKLESLRSLKAELSAESLTEVEAFHAATEPTMPQDVALGVGKRDDGEHVLVVRTTDATKADEIFQRAAGEADVRLITVTKRTTPEYFKARRRPLECGLQVAMADRDFVGTLGCFVRDARGLYMLSNAHVLADEGLADPGHRIGQPFPLELVAVLSRFVPLSLTVPNLVDAAIARLDSRLPAITGWTSALPGPIASARAVTPDDLGRPVLKVGRTTGLQKGKITVVELDGLLVGYTRGTLRFNDQVEISGGAATDFSAPGDSGSLIVDEAGVALALLFAGGRDSRGVDRTYGNRIDLVLSGLGVALA